MEIVSNMIEAHIFRETDNGIEFLLLKRSQDQIYPGLWQMVTGSIEENEKAYEAALREIKEETGFIPTRFWVVPNVNPFYSHEKNRMVLMPVFAALVEGNKDVKMCEEHCDYCWVSPEESKKLLAWPGQEKSVDIITGYFSKQRNFFDLLEIKI